MNKFLLLCLLGFVLIVAADANEDKGEDSLKEIESSMEEVEVEELADAKKCNGNKCKGRKNNKKAKKSKKKAKKNKKKAKKNKKKSKKQKKKSKKNKKQNRNNSSARNENCDMGCLDSGIKIMKTVKDKISNYLRQAIRAERQGKIGTGKKGKKDIFKDALDDLIEAGGGNESMLMCAGNATNDGAVQMMNLTSTLSNCSSAIKTACGNESFPTPPDAAKVDDCKMHMDAIVNMSTKCLKKTGAEACTCWSDAEFTNHTDSIKECSMKKYSKDVTSAKKKCVQEFGKCKKYRSDVGKQIHLCNQDSTKLTAKLGAAQANNDSLAKIKAKSEALVSASSNGTRNIRAITTCSAYLSTASSLIASITDTPVQSPTEIIALVLELEAFSGGCTADEITELSSVVTSVDTAFAAVAAVVEKIQASIVALTGAPSSAEAIAAAVEVAVNGVATTSGATTSAAASTTESMTTIAVEVAVNGEATTSGATTSAAASTTESMTTSGGTLGKKVAMVKKLRNMAMERKLRNKAN